MQSQNHAHAWRGFKGNHWQTRVDVPNFIQENYTPYTGDETFLRPPTLSTKQLWETCEGLIEKEIQEGVLDIDTTRFSAIDAYPAGYIQKEFEVIFGLQGDAPLKRLVNPYGGFRMVEASLEAYQYQLPKEMSDLFQQVRKTHNQGVFDVYTPQMKTARKVGLLTGLPDAYGRGRIIGDYRRVALYGVDFLLQAKKQDLDATNEVAMTDEVLRDREALSEQIRALKALKRMGDSYGFDLSRPATNATEAVQWFYFGYLAGIKENNGAAMSLGRNTTFLDIFIQRDLDTGALTEDKAQELIDQLVIKLRLVRHLRTPDYNTLFAGDPTWVTEAIGGMSSDGRTQVTKTAFRFLHTLNNLGPAPEPNMTVLWSASLPRPFKVYCARMSAQTGAIQYENDDLMRPLFTDDYAIACCVSAMTIGKQMQYFGARTNLVKALLYAINGGRDEIYRDANGDAIQVLRTIDPLKNAGAQGEILDFDQVYEAFKGAMDEVAHLYANTMNAIHYMHDKYAYESVLMALHDTDLERLMAYGIAGISIVADSLSAIKYAQVKPVRDHQGIAVDFKISGDFPQYGNDDDRVDHLAVEVSQYFMDALRKHRPLRGAQQSLSLLTITSNVVYGKKTGATPDGRPAGAPFAPGANPMHGRDKHGALASLNTVAKLPYASHCRDGISNTFSIVPTALGKHADQQYDNLVGILDGYFGQGGFHLNVNVLSQALLIDALEHPEKYPTLTIRVSGYAVHFNRLTREQKLEVISRTYHGAC